MDRDIFISYIEEDGAVARAMASELRSLGHTTWTYEEDGVAGISYLTQVHRAIEVCRAFVLLASQKSVKANQVIREVEQAHEREKIIIALRLGLTHQQFVASNPILRMATGTAVTLSVEPERLTEVAQRITSTLRVAASDSGSAAATPAARSTQPVEGDRRGSAPVTTAAPAPSRVGAPVVGSDFVSSDNVTNTPLNVPAKPSTPRTLWQRYSLWIGIGVQIVWGALMAFLWTTDTDTGLITESLGLTTAIGICLAGLLIARYCSHLRRSSDSKSVTYVASVRRLLLLTLICGFTMSVTIVYVLRTEEASAQTAVIAPLVLILPCILAVTLVWNGLRQLHRPDTKAPD